MSTTVKNIFLIMFKTPGGDNHPHTHASIKRKQKSLWPWKKAAIQILVELLQIPLEIDEGKRPATCLTFRVFITRQSAQCTEAASGRQKFTLSLIQNRNGDMSLRCTGTSQHAYSNTSRVGRAWLVLREPGSAIQMALEQH